jgi:hypothetical protein
MDRYNEYRKRAHEAQALAEQTKNATDKSTWLRIAQSWMDMLPTPKESQSAEQLFDAGSKSKGTGQPDSQESH